jgi:hypothetical protein
VELSVAFLRGEGYRGPFMDGRGGHWHAFAMGCFARVDTGGYVVRVASVGSRSDTTAKVRHVLRGDIVKSKAACTPCVRYVAERYNECTFVGQAALAWAWIGARVQKTVRKRASAENDAEGQTLHNNTKGNLSIT